MVRKATTNDIQRILELLVQVDMVHHEGRPDLFKGPATKYNAEELQGIINDETTPVFVCENDEGYVVGHAFCIHKQVIGDSVLTDVVDYAKKKNYYNITLNVWTCNPGATKFYEAMGLKPQKTCMEQIL